MEQLAGRIIDSLGGEIEEKGRRMVISKTNTSRIKQYALYEQLRTIAQDVVKG